MHGRPQKGIKCDRNVLDRVERKELCQALRCLPIPGVGEFDALGRGLTGCFVEEIGGSRRLAGQARRDALRVGLLTGFKFWNFARTGCRSISDSMSMDDAASALLTDSIRTRPCAFGHRSVMTCCSCTGGTRSGRTSPAYFCCSCSARIESSTPMREGGPGHASCRADCGGLQPQGPIPLSGKKAALRHRQQVARRTARVRLVNVG